MPDIFVLGHCFPERFCSLDFSSHIVRFNWVWDFSMKSNKISVLPRMQSGNLFLRCMSTSMCERFLAVELFDKSHILFIFKGQFLLQMKAVPQLFCCYHIPLQLFQSNENTRTQLVFAAAVMIKGDEASSFMYLTKIIHIAKIYHVTLSVFFSMLCKNFECR